MWGIGSDGGRKPLPRLGVELVDIRDGSVVKQVRSEFDGYYIFEQVLPGKYKLQITQNDLQRLNVKQELEIPLDITANSDVYSGREIRLRKNDAPMEISHRD